MPRYFYAVKIGYKPGIYKTWDECEKQIKGFPGAKHHKFSKHEDALNFLSGESEILSAIENETIIKNTLYAYVDGSFNNIDKIAGYGLVLVQNDTVVFKDLGAFRSMEMNESKNVFGELRGALKAVELALANNFKSITIVYDFLGIEYWATGHWRANKILTQDYKEFMQKYMKKINISFKKVKSHSGEDKYNDMADILAKKAVEIR